MSGSSPIFGSTFNKSNYTIERLKDIVCLIFQSADFDDIQELEELESLATYLSELPGIVAFAHSISNKKALFDFIQNNDVKAEVLDTPNRSAHDEFQFVFTLNAYVINFKY
ncbi:MAG: hypothetical protein IPK08_12935 [Bacteroidetes bacterium]|nr:hypothetical protein [Bacteroidota bacterium]